MLKIKLTKQQVLPILFFLVILTLNIYFYWIAYRWDVILNQGDDWLHYPEISNLSGSFEYLKALVKIVTVDLLAILGWLIFSKKK